MRFIAKEILSISMAFKCVPTNLSLAARGGGWAPPVLLPFPRSPNTH